MSDIRRSNDSADRSHYTLLRFRTNILFQELFMSIEQTFCMLKPDTVKNRHIGEVLAMIEKAGFEIKKMKLFSFTLQSVEEFYAVHKGKEFYERLIKFMISGPVVALLLEKDDAINSLRELIGSTDPTKAAEGTIRKLYGTGSPDNAVHASDSVENAALEASLIF